MTEGQGFLVDPRALHACADDLLVIRERAAKILELAEDANPDWYIWGLIGIPLAQKYWDVAADVYRHLAMMGEALEDRAEALKCTAQAYTSVDQELHNAFTGIREMLD